MAILKYRMRRWNGITYDTLHLETESSMITDFTNAVQALIPGDTHEHRPIQVNGTQILGEIGTPLNLEDGANVTLQSDGGTVTINATDTTYSSLSAEAEGADVSLVTTGEKYIWNNKVDTTDSRLSDARTPTSHTHGNITNAGTLDTASRIVVTDSNKNIITGSIDPTNIVLTTDSRLSDARTPTSHSHGNITNDGKITATGVALANNDALVIVDSSDSSILKKTSIVFDGSTTSQALTKKGTWGTFLTSSAHTVTVNSGKKSDGSTDITGTSASAASPTVTLGDSGATAGSYGDSDAQTPAYGGTFKVPYVSVNAKGVVTGISEHTVTIPTSDNTDTKVTQTVRTTNGNFPLLLRGTSAGTTTTTTTTTFGTKGTFNPSTGLLSVTDVANSRATLPAIVVADTQPTSPSTGDFWVGPIS